MNYCTNQKRWVEKEVQKKVDILIKHVLNDIPETESIILAGGYGRGEGGVKITGKNVELINDFDVYTITEEKISDERLNKAANKATQEYGYKKVDFKRFVRKNFSNMFYVDLKCIPIKKLEKLPPMIRYYDIKNNSRIIYGKDYRKLIPDYKPSDIPFGEKLRMLLNRATHLLQYFSIDFFEKISESEKEWLEVFFSKAIMDSAKVIEMVRGEDSPNSMERKNKFKARLAKDPLLKDIPNFISLLDKYTKDRLNIKKLRIKNHIDEWFEIKKTILTIIKNYLSHEMKKEIENNQESARTIREDIWKKYVKPFVVFKRKQKTKIKIFDDFLTFLGQYYLNLIYSVRTFETYNKFNIKTLTIPRTPDQRFFPAMIMLLDSIEKNEINEKKLRQAEEYLREVYPVTITYSNTKERWEEINKEFCQAYLLFSFLKIS